MIKILYFCVVIIKYIVFFFLVLVFPELRFTGGDSDFYNEYALGLDVPSTSIWPEILRDLNTYGFYNRNFISLLIYSIANLIVPYLIYKIFSIELIQNQKRIKKVFWLLCILITTYPTIYVYSMDIFRDVLMIVLFICCISCVKRMFELKNIFSVYFLILHTISCYALFSFRPYLGFSTFVALPITIVISKFNFQIKYFIILFIIMLNILNLTGYLDLLYLYRESGGFDEGGSTLGITMSGKNFLDFSLSFTYSMLLQLFGFYINSFGAIFVFISESLLFISAIIYIFKNRFHTNRFILYLLVFSIIYSTIWIIANDNLGTAIRLRIFSYLSIYFVAFIIYINKNNLNSSSI